MITLQNLSLRRGVCVLFEDLNWTIYHKQRIGIIGENGAGKTSLFALLQGELKPDQGELTIARQIKLAHVAQETPGSTQSALSFVLDGDDELHQLENALSAANAAADGHRIASLHARLQDIDAYTAPSRAAQLLAGLGFQHGDQAKPVSAFSGGFRVRLNLARALMARSDVLLLDEPTNHLDLDAVMWLEQWLQQYTGTLLLISHDRDFLDRVVDHIAYLANRHITLYTGDYSTFEVTRANQLALQQATHEKQQKKIAHLQSFVNRFRAKATKAKQAQSRLKAIERIELVSAVQADSPFQFEFKAPPTCPNPMLTLEKASIQYGTKTILQDVHLSITPKDRIALIGPNGAGKSSLIKLLAGELQASSGLRTPFPNLKIGYFAQHQVDRLCLDESALDHMRSLDNEADLLTLRTYLGSFGFSEEKALQAVRLFSGGEKSRLALALLVWQKPNLLLLDEPTNHLDLAMREALSLALQTYEGAMILVSHDRFLVRTTVDQLWLVAEGGVKPFDGDLNDYQRWLIDYRKANAVSEAESSDQVVSRKEKRKQAAQERENIRPLQQKIKQLEAKLARLQKSAIEIERVLADTDIYEPVSKDRLQALLIEQANNKKEVEQTEEAWLLACEERDSFIE